MSIVHNQRKIANVFCETGVFLGCYFLFETADSPWLWDDGMVFRQVSFVRYAAEKGRRVVVSMQKDQPYLGWRYALPTRLL